MNIPTQILAFSRLNLSSISSFRVEASIFFHQIILLAYPWQCSGPNTLAMFVVNSYDTLFDFSGALFYPSTGPNNAPNPISSTTIKNLYARLFLMSFLKKVCAYGCMTFYTFPVYLHMNDTNVSFLSISGDISHVVCFDCL